MIPAAFRPYAQFVAWKLSTRDGKQIKLPIHYKTGAAIDPHDPANWMTAEQAEAYQGQIGFVFTEADPFFFVDLDKCLTPQNQWSDIAKHIMGMLPGAYIEISQSGKGLHIFGTGTPPDHACKNVAMGLELYTQGRFVALTGTHASGDAGKQFELKPLVEAYFAPKVTGQAAEWTDGPVDGYTATLTDDELIAKASQATSAAGAFGGKLGFAALWAGETSGDASSDDMALAAHLAFWTGKDCERIKRLMLQSGLVRDKWEREDYLPRTILNACSLQTAVYGQRVEADPELPAIKGASDAQVALAERKRAEVINTLPEVAKTKDSAKFWIDTDFTAPAKVIADSEPIISDGWKYASPDHLVDIFKGCVYIQDIHRIFTPSGALLKSEQFNATYGGFDFQMNTDGKTTRKAWEVFTEGQMVVFPRAASSCFRPNLPSGAIVEEEGRRLCNVYVPVPVNRQIGDVTLFLDHLAKILPVERDRSIALSYMAACVQYKGVKFKWAPLFQGVPGNGKSLLTECTAAAVGERYTHRPRAQELDEKFNAWLFDKLLIGIEDVYVPEHKREILEILKPMITEKRLARRAMQTDQVMADACANFILNSNHKDAIRKTIDDRRFAVFYTAQQSKDDLVRDGMDWAYFNRLYGWLESGGYACVSEFLHAYKIVDEFNPALGGRAPETSSTEEAVSLSMGTVEYEIIEAVSNGSVPGMRGGWISSIALTNFLVSKRMDGKVPANKRREMLKTLGYDYHPSLHDGRVNNGTMTDGGGKPRLFIHKDSPHHLISSAAEVVRQYEVDQGMIDDKERSNG